MSEGTRLYFPGQPIENDGTIGTFDVIGNGLYKRNNTVRSALVGFLDPLTKYIPQTKAKPPTPSSVVIGHVIRLSPTQATISISVVDGVALPPGEDFTGVIRAQDVRSTEKDRVKIADCFRNGDIVRGLVISLGDSRSYYVTTARNDLGVIFAESEAGKTEMFRPVSLEFMPDKGAIMMPISWQEMRCPKTGTVEKRKCAKPDGL